MTDRYAVIGHPIAHSKSPWIHARFARETRQDIEYRAIEAPLEGFERVVAEFRAAGGRGLNVTLPFKERAHALATRVSDRAQAAGAVNTLAFDDAGRAFGDNTDGIGLLTDLTHNLGFAPAGKRVLLMGAGGAARGVLAPLALSGAARIVVANRTPQRALALAAGLPGASIEACSYDALAGQAFDLVVNATSLGLLAGELPPLPAGPLAPGTLAYDMVYGKDTPFLALARAAGASVSDGLGMLVEQAAESFLVWRGVRPETRRVLEALRAA